MTHDEHERRRRPGRAAASRRAAVVTSAAVALASLLTACTNFSESASRPAPPPPPAPKTAAQQAAPTTTTLPGTSLQGWHRVFADDFRRPVPVGSFPAAVSASWYAYADGTKDTTRNGSYMPTTTVSIADGVLNVHVHTAHGRHMGAALLPVVHGAHGHEGGLLYGRYMLRVRADSVDGYKASLLLWPDSETWPRDGEIDYPEADLGGLIHGYLHYQGARSGGQQAGFVTDATYGRWHTMTLTWLPHFVQFQLDGQIVGTVTSGIPNTPMHPIIQIETRTIGAPPDARAAGNVQLAWLAVYTPACNPGMSVRPAAAACTE